MRYQKPFTLDQRQDAISIYQSLELQIRRIRYEFPPRNDIERNLARDFRRVVREFARELVAKDAKVNVRRLNAVLQQATDLGVRYACLRNKNSNVPRDT